MIAHRLSTIRGAGPHRGAGHGRVAEQGTHDELLGGGRRVRAALPGLGGAGRGLVETRRASSRAPGCRRSRRRCRPRRRRSSPVSSPPPDAAADHQLADHPLLLVVADRAVELVVPAWLTSALSRARSPGWISSVSNSPLGPSTSSAWTVLAVVLDHELDDARLGDAEARPGCSSNSISLIRERLGHRPRSERGRRRSAWSCRCRWSRSRSRSRW